VDIDDQHRPPSEIPAALTPPRESTESDSLASLPSVITQALSRRDSRELPLRWLQKAARF